MDDLFGPYRLTGLLGRGGMGEVHRAFDTVRQREVALKVLRRELAAQPEFRERFRRESLLAARLQEPHVVPIHDFGEIDGRLFLDMRLVEGSDAGELLAREGPFAARRAVDVVGQVASALDAAHAAGMVHRDVKPSNVLVTGSGFAYLVDFGVARAALDTAGGFVTGTGVALLGSLTYMSPEQFTGGPVDGRTDVYSLACVLHELLTGRAPFPGSSLPALMQAHLDRPPPSVRATRPEMPAALDGVVARGMAKRPEDRFPTAGALAAAARAALDAPVPFPVAAAPAPPRRRGWLVGGGLAAAALAVATGVALTSGTPSPGPVPTTTPAPTAPASGTATTIVADGLDPAQQELVDLLDPAVLARCFAPQLPPQDAAGVVAAVECSTRGLGPSTSVVVLRFGAGAELAAIADRDAAGVTNGPGDDVQNCRAGQRNGRWERGRVVCRRGVDARLRIAWSDDARLVYAYAEGEQTVFSTWWEARRALVR